jgi:pimeloyl-ACP methyl ester carboxylesterase
MAWSTAAAQSPGRAGYLTADSSRIYYEECGTGPALVLVHDGVMGASTWDAAWPDLCTRFHALRYDRRGVGRSSAARIPFSEVEDLAALVADRHITAATIVGSSAGGALAIEFVLAHPDKVSRLVLLGPVVNGMGYSDHFIQRNHTNLAPVDSGNDSAAAANQANDRYAIAPGHDAARRKVLETLLANPQNLRSTGDALEQWPIVPAAAHLGDVRVPTLILVGEFDIPDVHAHAGGIEFGIWGSRREIVRDAGHLLQLEQPALLRDTLVAFVAETPVVTVSPQRLQSLVGTYTPFVRDFPGSFSVKDGRLTGHVDRTRDVPLFPSSDSTFYALTWQRFHVTFHRDPHGRATSADITISGVTHRATVVSPVSR